MSGGEGVRNPADLTLVSVAIEVNRLLLVVLQATCADIHGDLETVDAIVDAILVHTTLIEAITSALPTLSETGGALTTDGTEQNVYVNANPLGVFNPICVKIDCTAHTGTETIVIREYNDIAPGGAGLLLVDTLTYAGAIAPPIIIIDLDPNRYGVSVTMEKTVGTNRAYPWEAFYEI